MTKPRRAIRFSLIGLFVLMTLAALYFALIQLGGMLVLVAVAGATLSGQQQQPTVPADTQSADTDRDPADRNR